MTLEEIDDYLAKCDYIKYKQDNGDILLYLMTELYCDGTVNVKMTVDKHSKRATFSYDDTAHATTSAVLQGFGIEEIINATATTQTAPEICGAYAVTDYDSDDRTTAYLFFSEIKDMKFVVPYKPDEESYLSIDTKTRLFRIGGKKSIAKFTEKYDEWQNKRSPKLTGA